MLESAKGPGLWGGGTVRSAGGSIKLGQFILALFVGMSRKPSMREDWTLENDFIYRDAPLPDDLESIFESMDLKRGGYISACAFIGAIMPRSVWSTWSLCKMAFSTQDRSVCGAGLRCHRRRLGLNASIRCFGSCSWAAPDAVLFGAACNQLALCYSVQGDPPLSCGLSPPIAP